MEVETLVHGSDAGGEGRTLRVSCWLPVYRYFEHIFSKQKKKYFTQDGILKLNTSWETVYVRPIYMLLSNLSVIQKFFRIDFP